MKRNIDKIKDLNHELGRYQKKQRDDAARIKELQRQNEQAKVGVRELSAATDSVLGELARLYGEQKAGGVFELRLPLISCRRVLRDFVIHADWGRDNDSIIVTATPREGDANGDK